MCDDCRLNNPFRSRESCYCAIVLGWARMVCEGERCFLPVLTLLSSNLASFPSRGRWGSRSAEDGLTRVHETTMICREEI